MKITGIIFDYWQLVSGKDKRKSTAEHLDEVAQWIADYCRRGILWSIVMGQINQEGNTRGGEGMRLAFDQVYQIHRPDLGKSETWIAMMETRYTASEPGLREQASVRLESGSERAGVHRIAVSDGVACASAARHRSWANTLERSFGCADTWMCGCLTLPLNNRSGQRL